MAVTAPRLWLDGALVDDTEATLPVMAHVANVFAVVRGAVWTPPLRYVLGGVTRASVLAIARAEGIPVREEPLPLETFQRADEAFLSGTSMPLAPISHVNGRAMSAAPGPVTAHLTQRLVAIQSGHDEAFGAWLTYVRESSH